MDIVVFSEVGGMSQMVATVVHTHTKIAAVHGYVLMLNSKQ